MTERIELGEGFFSWPSEERRSDRYGRVRLLTRNGEILKEHKHGTTMPDAVAKLSGKKVRLLAVVRDVRTSAHIGDLARGIGPSKPKVGDEIVFGKGAFIIDRDEFGRVFGVDPGDGRASDHLDPEQLYRAHDQHVVLFVETLE